MQTGVFTTNMLIKALHQLQSRKLTGKLFMAGGKPLSEVWCVYFYLGQIVWAAGSHHPVRRWLRSLQQYCPTLLTEEWSKKSSNLASQQTKDSNHWTMQLMVQALTVDAIERSQVQSILHQGLRETLFGILNQAYLQTRWEPWSDIPQEFVQCSINPLLRETFDQVGQWKHLFEEQRPALPSKFSPDFAIVVKNDALLKARVSANTYKTLTKLLDGQHTFWDMASVLNKPLMVIAKSLFPLLQDKIIQVQQVPDQALPALKVSSKTTAKGGTASGSKATNKVAVAKSQPETSAVHVSSQSKGLIACVDDSPLIGEELESILKPFGYQVLSILDPLQGVSTLLRHKPRLIFLDLIMPNTNGYELCTFLRKSAVFRDTPIVMLTGRDGVFDRLRAKVAGSNDFLSKPPEAAKVLQVVQKFLGDELTPEPTSPGDATGDGQWTLAQEAG